MVIKQGNFPYNISEFENRAKKHFPNSDIYVGAAEGVDEEIIQAFLENVMDYEIAHKDSEEKNRI